jgi:transcriptional regulator with XRE-family HTH domain
VRIPSGRNRVRAVRAQKGLSQEALADAAGIDRSYMSGIERGVRNITIIKLHAVARALRVEICDLVERD